MKKITMKFNNMTVLIVDDELLQYFRIRGILKNLDVTLIYAKNGKEAVDFIKSEASIDLILMDYNMPIMDGVEAAKAINRIDPTIPIIAHSGYDLKSENYLHNGVFDEYLKKSLCVTELKNVVLKYHESFIDKRKVFRNE